MVPSNNKNEISCYCATTVNATRRNGAGGVNPRFKT